MQIIEQTINTIKDPSWTSATEKIIINNNNNNNNDDNDNIKK